jgi:hypothetical protein
MAERLDKVAQIRQQRRDEALGTILKQEDNPEEAEQNRVTDVVRYMGLGERASDMGYWIPCKLKAYEGMEVLFRTNNKTKVRRERPNFEEPATLREKRHELATVETELLTEGLGLEKRRELDERRVALVDEVLEAARQYEDEYHMLQCKWLANFVLDFSPWPFKDIKRPKRSDPESYFVLYEELEDLYAWLLPQSDRQLLMSGATGYTLALRASSKN